MLMLLRRERRPTQFPKCVMPRICLGAKDIVRSLQGAADSNPGSSVLLNENHSAASFWAGAYTGDDDFAWCVQSEQGALFPRSCRLVPVCAAAAVCCLCVASLG